MTGALRPNHVHHAGHGGVLRTGSMAGTGEAGEHLLGTPEGEIVQHQNDFLPILAQRYFVLDDQGAVIKTCSCMPTCECIQYVPEIGA